MQKITSAEMAFVPAGHEDPLSPGVLKKVLFRREDLQPGSIQMVNWSKLRAGRCFAAHYHEDMQEMFIMIRGKATIVVDGAATDLQAGDTVLLEPGEVHAMHNPTEEDTLYLAIGIAGDTDGKTVLVDGSP